MPLVLLQDDNDAFSALLVFHSKAQPAGNGRSLVKGCNVAVGHQASALRVGFSAPMDCVAPLGKKMALPGEPRLAMNAEKPTEGVIIVLKEY